jgi:hypothetical protein
MKTTIELAREAGFDTHTSEVAMNVFFTEEIMRLVALVRADEREANARKVEVFARKWWKIHCDSNLHYSSTLRAHQDFCALQAVVRAGESP